MHKISIPMKDNMDKGARAELPMIAQIIQDEVWLEGERRG